MVKLVKSNFMSKRSTGMLLLVIEKAFDTTWHEGLLHKLLVFEYPMPLIKIIQSFLADRFFFVNVFGENSEKFFVPAGLPQGSVLSPCLYNLFTADLKVPRDSILAQFADDTGVLSSGKKPSRSNDHSKRYRNTTRSGELKLTK